MRDVLPSLPELTDARAARYVEALEQISGNASFDAIRQTAAKMMTTLGGIQVSVENLRSALAADLATMRDRSGAPTNLSLGPARTIDVPPHGDLGLYFRAPVHYLMGGGLELTLLRAFGSYLDTTNQAHLWLTAERIHPRKLMSGTAVVAAEPDSAELVEAKNNCAKFNRGEGANWEAKAAWIATGLARVGATSDRLTGECAESRPSVVELAGGAAVIRSTCVSARSARAAAGSKGGLTKRDRSAATTEAESSIDDSVARARSLPAAVAAATALSQPAELTKRQQHALALRAAREREEAKAASAVPSTGDPGDQRKRLRRRPTK